MPLKNRRLVVVCVAVLASCEGRHERTPTFSVAFVVESDPGSRVGGASVALDGQSIGRSDSHGLVRVQISRPPGARLVVTHECPEGYEAPAEGKRLRLRNFVGLNDFELPVLEVRLRCDPTTRVAAFVVRAKNGADLPVLFNGRIVARTNQSGVAHFSIRAGPGSDHAVELDTRAHPRLRPQSPTHLFTLPDASEIFVVDQPFELKSESPRRRRRPKITKIE